jgi:hypothetical protein
MAWSRTAAVRELLLSPPAFKNAPQPAGRNAAIASDQIKLRRIPTNRVGIIDEVMVKDLFLL